MSQGFVQPDQQWNTRSRVRGLVCACTMAFAFSANYTNHAPLVPALTGALRFNLALAGLLTTGIFLTHAAMQIPGGNLADRLGPRPIVTAALAVVCLGNFGIAFSKAYWHLLFWKVFVGFGTGSCFVAGARYIAGSYSGRKLNLAQGLYGGSILLGSGFVIYGVSLAAAAVGWRGAFMLTAGVAGMSWILWVIAAPLHTFIAQPAGSLRGLLSDIQLWLLGAVQMASFGLVIVVSAWITVFLQRDLSFSQSRAGLLGSLALLLGILTRPLGGAILHLMGIKRLFQISLGFVFIGCLLLARTVGSLGQLIAAIVLLGIGCGFPYAALFVRAAVLYPGRAGAAMGLVNMLGIVMILAAPPLIGQMVEWTGSFQAAFLSLGLFSVIAFAGTFGIKEP